MRKNEKLNEQYNIAVNKYKLDTSQFDFDTYKKMYYKIRESELEQYYGVNIHNFNKFFFNRFPWFSTDYDYRNYMVEVE
ncbi:hypothetical protein ACKXGF_07405 [Alkalibacillus sp. S2W]|uniref:hypothetical protein n=1 Tax=Alkalibacillus sp. S2W TaxID=3386553 RepID=UPI00398D2694